MFNYLIIFGCGAITYLLAEKCSNKTSPNWYSALITFLMCAMLNMVTTYLILSPFGRITRVDTVDGITEISYGSSAIFLAIIIALLWGIAFGFIKKNVDIKAQINKK
ncbi:hypothetical protein C809_03444 [Lachnospiraceae bacterium MD335]|jgi:cellobiose-specific phosphotransferase system component IIC|nr:hypothetical protein C809_03444 [Lachnospiraceae bacterium MD335]